MGLGMQRTRTVLEGRAVSAVGIRALRVLLFGNTCRLNHAAGLAIINE